MLGTTHRGVHATSRGSAGLLWLVLGASALPGCAGTRSTLPRGDGALDTGGLSFKETGWTPSWTDGTEAALPAHDGPRLDQPPTPKPDLPKPKPDLPPPPCPGGCDDGNPCTADACNGTSCDHTPIGQIVVRYLNPSTGAHAYAPAGAGPAGFGAEGPVFRTLQAGGQAIYQQTNGKDYMLSLSASEGIACCGYQNYGSIGNGFAAQQNGTVPLYRFYHGSSHLHFSSLSSTEGTAAGYTLEGVTVYVCP